MLWRLGLPNGIAWLFWTMATFADAFFIGFLGTEALAVLALVFPFQMLMLMMSEVLLVEVLHLQLGELLEIKILKKQNHHVFILYSYVF